MSTIIFVIFSGAQGRSRQVLSSKQLFKWHPEARNLKEAAEAEAATWDINPVIETHQGYKYKEGAEDNLKNLIYAILHMRNMPNATDLYYNMDFYNITSTMIQSVFIGQTVYYYVDDIDNDELIDLVKTNQK